MDKESKLEEEILALSREANGNPLQKAKVKLHVLRQWPRHLWPKISGLIFAFLPVILMTLKPRLRKRQFLIKH